MIYLSPLLYQWESKRKMYGAKGHGCGAVPCHCALQWEMGCCVQRNRRDTHFGWATTLGKKQGIGVRGQKQGNLDPLAVHLPQLTKMCHFFATCITDQLFERLGKTLQQKKREKSDMFEHFSRLLFSVSCCVLCRTKKRVLKNIKRGAFQ